MSAGEITSHGLRCRSAESITTNSMHSLGLLELIFVIRVTLSRDIGVPCRPFCLVNGRLPKC